MTMSGSPFIRFYEKLGAKWQSDHEHAWIGGAAVTSTALLFEARDVEALLRTADGATLRLKTR
ncbi:hypothetical protein CBS101457_000682 [Exobasidium rhododendri]|nr:hypothetical protein CBS101457_000682 [Exobasidium rhododendri]